MPRTQWEDPKSWTRTILVEAVDTREFPIDLLVLDLVHEVIIIDDKEESSNKDDIDDEDGAKQQEGE